MSNDDKWFFDETKKIERLNLEPQLKLNLIILAGALFGYPKGFGKKEYAKYKKYLLKINDRI